MLQHHGWEHIISAELNDMQYKEPIYTAVGKGLTVLLPKIAKPQTWGDCRPITLSSTVLKLLAHLLVGRASDQIRQAGETTMVPDRNARSRVTDDLEKGGPYGQILGGGHLDCQIGHQESI